MVARDKNVRRCATSIDEARHEQQKTMLLHELLSCRAERSLKLIEKSCELQTESTTLTKNVAKSRESVKRGIQVFEAARNKADKLVELSKNLRERRRQILEEVRRMKEDARNSRPAARSKTAG